MNRLTIGGRPIVAYLGLIAADLSCAARAYSLRRTEGADIVALVGLCLAAVCVVGTVVYVAGWRPRFADEGIFLNIAVLAGMAGFVGVRLHGWDAAAEALIYGGWSLASVSLWLGIRSQQRLGRIR